MKIKIKRNRYWLNKIILTNIYQKGEGYGDI